MKVASYNLENLFMRPVVMNQQSQAAGRAALQAHATLNAILSKTAYSAADKKRIIELLKELKLDKKDDGGPYALLRQNRGHLLKRPKSGGVEVVANGRGDWIGWVELKREEVNEVATATPPASSTTSTPTSSASSRRRTVPPCCASRRT